MMQFWFEFASTYSYVAAMRIEDVARTYGVAIEWRPFLLGPIFHRQGWNDSPFNLYPQRGRYMWRDIERRCHEYGLEFRKPSRFPRNSLLAARVACPGIGESWLPEFARAVYRANFVDDREISDAAVIGEILTSLELDAATMLDRAQAPETKERLRALTDQAWELGIFGAPSLIAAGELFWGDDRLEDALEWAATSASRSKLD